MKIEWQQLIAKIFFWLLIEIIFTSIGIDDLADYSEFLLTSRVIIESKRSLAGIS